MNEKRAWLLMYSEQHPYAEKVVAVYIGHTGEAEAAREAQRLNELAALDLRRLQERAAWDTAEGKRTLMGDPPPWGVFEHVGRTYFVVPVPLRPWAEAMTVALAQPSTTDTT